MGIAENIAQLWTSSNYQEKQRLQYLLFPEGIVYDKENDTVLTNRINTLFNEILIQKQVLAEKNNGNPLQDCHFGNSVGITTASSNQILTDLEDILRQ